MKRNLVDSDLKLMVFSLLLTFSLIEATPSSYDLFQGSAYSSAGNRQRNKNWCAHVVHKNVTCAVLGNTESFVEPEVAPCPPHQPDCAQQVMYRTRFRPTYRIAYKMVTELEWRCCPGFQGPDCKELKGATPRQAVLGPRHNPRPNPGQFQHALRPQGIEPDYRVQRQGEDRMRQLEGEVQRLSQTVLDLQAAMTGMKENLREDFQEDTSKMILTLLNTLRFPDSALGGPTESVHLNGHAPGVEDMMTRLNHVTDTLKRKSDLLDDIQDTLNGHEGQLRLLTEASLGSAHAPSSDGPAHTLPSHDLLQAYVDRQLQKLKDELVQSMEEKMANLKSSCDQKILSVQKQCEGHETTLTELVDRKEADLRKDIRDLQLNLGASDGVIRTNRETAADEPQPDLSDLRREIERVAEAHRVLNARVDNELQHLSMLQIEDMFGPRLDDLEDRINVTERNTEVHCFYIEEKLTRLIADEVSGLRQLFDERLNSMEDQFTAMLVEINNSTFADAHDDRLEALQNEMNSSKYVLQDLEEKLNALGKACSTDCRASPTGVDNILRDLRTYKNDLDTMHSDVSRNSNKLQELETLIQRQLLISQHNSKNLASQQMGLNSLKGKVGHLEGSVVDLRDSLDKQAQDLRTVNSTCDQVSTICLAKAQSVQEALDGQLTPAATNSSQVEELKNRLDELSREVRAELSRRREGTDKDQDTGAGNVGGTLDSVSNSLQRVAENLARQVASLGPQVQRLNRAQLDQDRDISGLRNSIKNLQTQLSEISRTSPLDKPGARDGRENAVPPLHPASPIPGVSRIPHIRIPLIIPHMTPPVTVPHVPVPPHQPSDRQQPPNPAQPARPRRPVVETGEAGPPGTMRRIRVRQPQGSEDKLNPFAGFAGAPGHPSLTPVSFKPRIVPAAYIPQKPVSDTLVVTPAGGSVGSEPFSFSAALTVVPLPWDMGVIRFNKVLVNDGGHYNPRSGVFTVPQEGRYLISAVLTAQHGDRVEAALSVSDRSVQRLTTAGYGRYAPGVARAGPEGCDCGGSVSFSLILPLKRGDQVKLVKTAGKLATTETREVLSTFSAIFLYSIPNSR